LRRDICLILSVVAREIKQYFMCLDFRTERGQLIYDKSGERTDRREDR